ncbi:RNA-binding protein [uncultured Desulfatiglans sp.]|uniref:RNA-binding protein n=1 Tax=Uncultured Desulfatiglans sp. TaxID=1748965 RepID=A0A653A8L2_UNCDX|nr:RNA-binding protein [uncultured Desulfatiglans sp.]
MCEAHAFVLKGGQEEKLLENVDLLEVEGDNIRLVNIFGEQKKLKGVFRSYDNTQRKILIEPS